MIKKVFGLLLINFGLLMAFDNSKILQEPVSLSFGKNMPQDKRKDSSLSVHCPLSDKNETYCLINEFSFEKGTIGYSSFITTANQNLSISNVRNEYGSSSANINLYEILDPNFTPNNPKDTDESSEYARNLMRIIKNANGDNKYIFPLYVDSVKAFLYEKTTNDPKPFIGFAGLDKLNKDENPYMKALGLTPTNRTETVTINGIKSNIQFTDLIGAKPSSQNTNQNLQNLNYVANFGEIGDKLGEWLENRPRISSIKDSTLLQDLKKYFSITANDNNQTWSRIMAGVAVLDDAYVRGLNSDGEISLRDNSDSGVVPNTNDNIFKGASDGKLWGYYLYLSQNLHQLEILLILALAGGSFTFITGWKGFNYFRQIKTEQKEPLDWKKMILQPIAYTLIVATPLVPSNTTLYPDFILDSSPIVTDVEINKLNLNGIDKSKDDFNENLFYQTPLQVGIQGAVSFGSAIADEFSKSLTYSFALFLSFRENVMDDNSIMLTNLKKEYNNISKDLVTLSAYQTIYNSTCKYDYEMLHGNSELQILPNFQALNRYAENDAFSAKQLGLNEWIDTQKEKSANGFLSYQACQKIETDLNEKSAPLLNKLLKYSYDFTSYWRIYEANGGISNIDKEKQADLRAKLKMLSEYEKTYGWVNVAMIPLLYQIMYPSFNPYYYYEKTNSLNNSSSTQSDDILNASIDLGKYYVLIATPTSSNEQIIRNKENLDTDIGILDTKQSSDLKDSNPANSLISYVISMVSYSFMPGYTAVETHVKELNGLFGERDENGKNISTGNIFTRGLIAALGLLGDNSLGNDDKSHARGIVGMFGLSSLLNSNADTIINGALSKLGGDKLNLTKENLLAFSDMLLVKMASQSLYLYILNLMVMVILTMVLVFKIGMFFLQVIIFYMASPLVIIWAMITKKEEQVKNYISKASTLIFAPILITLSGTILILAVGIIHQVYFIIVNHIMKIQMQTNIGVKDFLTLNKTLADYIQLQAFFGIGNIILGFGYLLLGYVILIKFSHWFFETVGIQTQNSVTQSLESLTHRMRFGHSLGM